VELQVYHGTRYIDEVVGLRVKDQGRLYAHQDANWNVTALTDLTGRVIEQYWYSSVRAA
jgi:LytS/YehU family sensor histidine kinase